MDCEKGHKDMRKLFVVICWGYCLLLAVVGLLYLGCFGGFAMGLFEIGDIVGEGRLSRQIFMGGLCLWVACFIPAIPLTILYERWRDKLHQSNHSSDE